MSKRETNKELIKHSAAIHISNNLTLLQRKTWNVLLYNAFHELLDEETHTINIPELIQVLEFESGNQEYLKDALRGLIDCKVEWDILDKDGDPEWGVAPMISGAQIRKGVCTYGFFKPLKDRLSHPKLYARISLALQTRFTGKYALALWEFCTDYVGINQTPWLEIPEFRKLMGVSDGMYPEFKIFNRAVVKPAIKEINEVSDLSVVIEYRRKSRKVVAIKFSVERVRSLPKSNSDQKSLFPDFEDMPDVVLELINAGVVRKEALKIWNQGWDFVDASAQPNAESEDFEEYLREKIEIAKFQGKGGGFIRTAIKENWIDPKFIERQQEQAREEAIEEIRHLELEKGKITTVYEEQCQRIFGRIVTEYESMVDETVQEVVEVTPILAERYDGSKPFNEQSVMVQEMTKPKLKKKFPEMFEEVEQPYQEKIAKIDKQIADLQKEIT